MKGILSLAAVAAALVVLVAAAPASAAGPYNVKIGTYDAQVAFGDQPYEGADTAILAHLKSLIQATPSGAKIRVAINSVENIASSYGVDIERQLLVAQSNGVNVQVVHSGADDRRNTPLADPVSSGGLGPNHHWCDHGDLDGSSYGWGCISTHNGGGDPTKRGGMHKKYVLFSKTLGPQGMVPALWFGTANFTEGSGIHKFNTGVALFGPQALWDQMMTHSWNPMWNEQSFTNNDFRIAGSRGTFTVMNTQVKVDVSPEQDTAADPMIADLNETPTGTNCMVLVAHMQLTRNAVADKLASMKDRGCTVIVVVSTNDNGCAKISDYAKNKLIPRNIEVRKTQGLHDKLVLTHHPNRPYTVITGSHNMTVGALQHNDELLVRIYNSQSLWQKAYEHWYREWYYGHKISVAEPTCPEEGGDD